MGQLHFECLPLMRPLPFPLFVLLVCSHKGGEDAVLLVQQGLGSVVLEDDPPLHHNHQVGVQDGVDAMLSEGREDNRSRHQRELLHSNEPNLGRHTLNDDTKVFLHFICCAIFT